MRSHNHFALGWVISYGEPNAFPRHHLTHCDKLTLMLINIVSHTIEHGFTLKSFLGVILWVHTIYQLMIFNIKSPRCRV